MCDFLRKEKDALLSEPFPVTSSSGSVASPTGVKRKAVDNPEEPEKRQKKESTSEQSSKTSLTTLLHITLPYLTDTATVHPSISIKDFVREKKIRNRKKERAARAIFYEIEHQTS
jgi:hypothetical protein